MTRARACGVRSKASGLGINMKGATTIPSRAPQPQERPYHSPSQVRRSWPSGLLSGANPLMESGTQVWLYGGLTDITNVDGEYLSYPTAEYTLDGYPGES